MVKEWKSVMGFQSLSSGFLWLVASTERVQNALVFKVSPNMGDKDFDFLIEIFLAIHDFKCPATHWNNQTFCRAHIIS
jgi:hypothetical protein